MADSHMADGTLQVSLTKTHGLERRLEVAVPGERVAGEVDQRLKHLTRTARIKGFRPGKVPYAVVKQQFGSQVHAEAVSELMQRSFAEAVVQQKLRPAGGPRIEPIQVGPGSELRYAAVFEVLPEVAVKPLSGLQIERPVASVTEEDVDAMLDRMREQRPNFTEVERPAASGDRVTLDHTGRIDGEVFPGGAGQGLTVRIGTQQILPELEQGLIGLAAGDSRSVTARFPDDYGARAVAGKTAVFELRVIKVEESSVPVLDEAFARSLGITEGGVPALRQEVRENMERELAQAIHSRQRELLLERLYHDNPLELPRGMLDEQIEELQVQMMRRIGVNDPGKLPNREYFEPSARRRVALGLLIGEIVRAQDLKVDRARFEQRLEALVVSSPDPQEARRQYLANRDAVRQLESAALEDQAVDWMLSQVNIVERPSSFREVTGFSPGPHHHDGDHHQHEGDHHHHDGEHHHHHEGDHHHHERADSDEQVAP